MIPFNRPHITKTEIRYITSCLESYRLSGDGPYTQLATIALQKIHNSMSSQILLTTSCTDALEMTALLLGIQPGDEVIMPSYTFVSTALAFEMRGAKLIFADSEDVRPHINTGKIHELITARTKAIVVVHYAGEACDMDTLLNLSSIKNIPIIEDNAQGITSQYNNQSLGTLGAFGTLSFHESKNIVCGEGGALIINNPKYFQRAEIIREKGTNRGQFFRGETDKYNWVDLGSSYLPSDILAAVLVAQLEDIKNIQLRRMTIWNKYMSELNYLERFGITTSRIIPRSKGNGHIFYLVCQNLQQRTNFIEYMKNNGIHCVFHYLSLHRSPFFRDKYVGPELPNADRYTDCLVRLPLYVDLTDAEVDYIIERTKTFFGADS